MSVLCSHCGEELMGAVNRCWRCGQSIASHSGPLDIPPIRRSPITGPLNTPPEGPLEALVLADGGDPNLLPTVRRGSPFDQKSANPGVVGPSAGTGELRPERSLQPRSAAATAGAQFAAAVAVGVGLLAIGVSIALPIATVCFAMVAIGLGIWGLFGPQRRLAMFALVLACAALAWGAFGAAVQIYEMIYRVHPFAVLPP